MYLDISSPYLDGGLAPSRVCERLVQFPYSIVLGDRQSSQCAVKGPSRFGDIRLSQEEREVHFPYDGHFIQQDQRPLEQRVNLVELCLVFDRVSLLQVLDP